MKPHKHAELIKAWADGAEIEECIKEKWFEITYPDWYEHITYRIKPKLKPNAEMIAFKEIPIGEFILRFYKTDHVWTCTINEDALDAIIKIAKSLSAEVLK